MGAESRVGCAEGAGGGAQDVADFYFVPSSDALASHHIYSHAHEPTYLFTHPRAYVQGKHVHQI